MGCCHGLRKHYSHIIIQVAHGIMHLLVRPMKEVIHECFWMSFVLNIASFPAELHSVSPPIRLHIPSLALSSLVVIYKNCALKYQKMPWCHIPVLIYLLFLPLGLMDLDIKPGKLWLHIRTILFPPSMSPL